MPGGRSRQILTSVPRGLWLLWCLSEEAERGQRGWPGLSFQARSSGRARGSVATRAFTSLTLLLWERF